MTSKLTKDKTAGHPEKDLSFTGGHSLYTYDIHGTDTDYKDQIQMHSLFSMMQEAASLNADEYGWGAEVLDKLDTCWLLLRVSVKMTRRPSWQEKITIDTWSRGNERLFFLRDFIYYDGIGAKIGVGSSVWILANKTTHRPVRPVDLTGVLTIAADEMQAMSQNPPKVSPMADTAWMTSHLADKNTIVKFADFSEIDRNLHVNNTRYIAWCLDAAHSKSLDQGDILGIDINYNAEIHFGEKVVLFINDVNESDLHVDGFVAGTDRIAFSAILYRDESDT